jgi:tetratricopeptide (TPR) repeat protein
MRLRKFVPSIGFLWMLLFLLWARAQNAERAQQLPGPDIYGSDRETSPEQIWISGNAVKENGFPAVGAFIELDCRGSVTREATVDSSGAFSFRIGEGVRSNQQDQDMSHSLTDPFGRSSSMVPFNVGTIGTSTTTASKKLTSATRITGCTLSASLSGFKSSTLELGTTPVSMLNNVGTIALFPIERVRGTTVSATSLRAPKAAKKALDQATKALRKNRTGDGEKHLISATTIYSKYGEAWYQLGRLYHAQQRTNEARAAFKKAIDSDNRFATPYVWLGMIAAAEQKWQEAADLTERALDLDPSAFPEAYYLNALTNFYLTNMAAAEKSAHRVELLDSAHRFPKIHLILASAYAAKSNGVGLIEELRKYLKYGPRGKNAVQENGEARYLDLDWESASESTKKEIALGAWPEVRMQLAEVLLRAGMVNEAKAELSAYRKEGDIVKVPERLRYLLEPEQNYEKDVALPQKSNEKALTPKEGGIDYLHYSLLDQPDFESAGDQTALTGVLAAVGNNVSRLFDNLFNLSAVESVQLERSDRKGNADRSKDFKYLYLCLGAIDKRDPYFDEYRSDEQGKEIFQSGLDEGYMLTAGFMSSPLLFHPIHQDGNEFRLLGYQRLRGINTMVVAYAQIPGKCRLKGQFQAGKRVAETYKQGIAWIDAENYQIIRLISDLLKPIPLIGLDKLRTEIDFDKVRFDQSREEFWLPLQVVVTVDWNNRLLRNAHAYSDFRLFDVKTSQKIQQPKEAENPLADP